MTASELPGSSGCRGIGVMLGLYWVLLDFIELYWIYMGTMEKKMETTIMGYMGYMLSKLLVFPLKTL